MKFLVTGSIRQKRGPALLVSAAAVYLLLYAMAGMYRFAGSLPEEQFTSLSSPVALVEEMHSELFFSAMIFLFTGSVIREMFGRKSRSIILAVLFLAGISYPLVYLAAWYYRPLLIVYSGLYPAYLGLVGMLQLTVLYRLNR